MLCRRCMTVMETGTTYEQRKGDNKPSARRFHECKKCGDKVYTKEPNFQECMNKASEKSRKNNT